MSNQGTKTKVTSDLFEEVAQTLKVIGYQRTKSVIMQARTNYDPAPESSRMIEKFIIKETCTRFRISKAKLKDKGTRGNRTDCIMVIAVLLKRHLNYQLSDTHRAIGVHFTQISRLLRTFNEMQDKSRFEKMIKAHYTDIDDIVTVYAEQIKIDIKHDEPTT